MLNKILLIATCSLLIAGCNCNNPSGSSATKQAPMVYDVRCYESGVLVVDMTTTSTPSVRVDNTYWRDDESGELVDIAANCTVIPRRANEPKASLIGDGQIIND